MLIDDGNEQDLKVMHIDRDDLNLKEHKCLVCPRSFSKRSNWVQHLNFTHRMKMGKNMSNTIVILFCFNQFYKNI